MRFGKFLSDKYGFEEWKNELDGFFEDAKI
jgi:hypothetical protein